MITCSRCGNIVSAGQSSCQYCGMPVMNRSEYGANPDQPELPAWLQSLRAGTQPTYTTGGNFSASDLVEEGALPGWMRPGQPGQPGQSGQPDAANSLTGPQPALRPSSMPAPDTDGSVLPGGSMSASSLIDEQALPSWMREQAGERQRLAAASLVQPDALPDWLRNAPAGPQAQQSSQPLPPPVSGQPQIPQAPQASQTPPAIMSVPPPFAGAPQGQPISSEQPFQTPLQTAPPQAVFPRQELSARDLVDAQSLPPWLSGQPGTSANGEGLSAASLLDMNALPPWLRENGQGAQGSQATNPSAMNMNGSQPPSSAPMPPVPPQQPSSRSAPVGNLVAASFIDMDALPDWLRNAGDGQAGGAMPDQSRPTMGGIPPRVENVRVPGRPRGGVGPQEESAAAANAFASMLGVASNAPQLPVHPQQSQGQFPSQPAPGTMPGNGMFPGQTQGQVPTQGMVPGGPGGPEAQGQGYPGAMQGYGPQGYQAGPQGPQGYPVGYPGYPMGSQLGVSQPLPNQGMMAPPAPSGQPVQSGRPGQVAQIGQIGQAKPAKAAKRGFLDTIREWFGLNS